LFDSLEDETLKTYITTRYASCQFPIDGVVVQVDKPYNRGDVTTNGNPNYAFAYKIITDSCETIVEDVIWTPSRYSLLKPRIQIKPVNLCGVTINYVTGSNAKFIHDNKINVGSKVLVIRAGEIIPKIETVITQSDKGGKMPSTPYKWTESRVDIISTFEDDTIDITVRRLVFFFSTIGVKYIAEGIVTKLVNHGYDDVFKIMEMTKRDFMTIPTFEEKMSEKIHKTLQSIRTTRIDCSVIMAASGIFGHGIGSKKLKVLLSSIPNILEIHPAITDIEKVDGFSTKTASKILEGLERFKEFYDKFSKYTYKEEASIFTPDEIELVKTSSRLTGMNFVFSNFRDAKMEKFLTDAGAKICESITKKTTYLVVPNENKHVTTKISKAQQYGIQILEKDKVYCL
jgi:NAD-dependent DNA ligase